MQVRHLRASPLRLDDIDWRVSYYLTHTGWLVDGLSSDRKRAMFAIRWLIVSFTCALESAVQSVSKITGQGPFGFEGVYVALLALHMLAYETVIHCLYQLQRL